MAKNKYNTAWYILYFFHQIGLLNVSIPESLFITSKYNKKNPVEGINAI